MMMHLDQKRLRALIEGSLSAQAEEELTRHLAREACPTCEEFLGTLDQEAERGMWQVLDRAAAATDLPQAARQQVLEAAFHGSHRFRRRMLVPAVAFGAVGLMVLSVFLWRAPEEEGLTGIRVKGGSDSGGRGVDLFLGAVVEGKDGKAAITRVASGGKITEDCKLVFRIHTPGPCYLTLVRVGGEGKPEMLLPTSSNPPWLHPGGSFTPTSAGQPAGISLWGLRGSQHFLAICSSKPLLLPEEIEPLTKGLGEGRQPMYQTDVLSYGVVTVEVSE